MIKVIRVQTFVALIRQLSRPLSWHKVKVKKRSILSVCAGLLLSQSVLAEPATQALTQKLALISSFQSPFKQLILDAKGANVQETKGLMQVKKPGLFRWETFPPYDQLLVANGKQLWVFDRDLEQVTVQELDQRLSSTPALLLSGQVKDLEAQYHVSGQKVDSKGSQDITQATLDGSSKGRWHFELRPKQADSLFESLKLVFIDDYLSEMQLQDSLGQKTNIVFEEPLLNPHLEDQLFTFIPPEGVDVLTQ